MKKFLLNILFLALATNAVAQGASQSKSKFLRKLQKTVWTIGLSGTVIDDDAKQFHDLFNVPTTWDFLYFPSKINIEGNIDHGFSIEGAFTYSQLKAGKLLGETNIPRPTTINLISFDINTKFNLNEVIGDTKFFSPYVIAGFGYTYRSYSERRSAITGNFGLGFNIWLVKGFGLNVQSIAKFALNNAYGKNYLQHSVGLVYRFNLLTGYKTPDRLGHRYNLFRNL